jgi:hypothetical protein
MSTLQAATGGYHVQKAPQFVDEYSFASTPTSASFSWIGVVDNFSPTADMSALEFRKVGSEDLTDQRKGTEVYTTSLEYFPQNATFFRRGVIAQGGGIGSPDNAVTVLTSVLLNGTENYIKLLGTRINSVKFTGRAGEPHKIATELWSYDITRASTDPNISGIITYTSDPGTSPWTFADGGNTPVSVSGNALPVTEMEANVTRALERIPTLGGNKVQYLPAKNRDIKGSFTTVWTTAGHYYNLQDFNGQSMQWILTSGTSLEMGNVNFTKLDSFSIKPTDIVYEKYSFTARSISVP